MRALRALRGEYLAAAPAKLAELWSTFDQVQNGDRPAMERLRVQVHHLAGSGGGYGLDDVTTHARSAEQLVERLLRAAAPPPVSELADLRAHLTGITDAFDQARSTE